MKTYVFNPLKQGTQDVFADEDGQVATPGAGDTVYFVSLPSITANLGGTEDLSPYVQPSLSYTIGGSATVANLFLVGNQGALSGPDGMAVGPTGPITVTLDPGVNLTITGTLSGQAALTTTAAVLDAVAKAAGDVPAPVAAFLAALDANAATLQPQTIGGQSTVIVDSSVNHRTALTIGALGEGLAFTLEGGNDALTIERPGTGQVTIDDSFTGFSGTDTIDLPGVGALVSTTANSFATSLGNTYTFTNFVADGVVAMSDGSGGVVLTACYAEGTRLLTDAGEIAIERLRVGDRLISARDGVARAIVWLGHRFADGRAEIPVRVRAGAFGLGLPHRDLTLSPDHAIFFEGALIPVRHLVNGDAVVCAPVDRVTYWHVELALHDVVLAEGLPAETYLDIGERDVFTTARRLPAYAASRAWEAGGCAPLTVTGETVRRARAILASQLRIAA